MDLILRSSHSQFKRELVRQFRGKLYRLEQRVLFDLLNCCQPTVPSIDLVKYLNAAFEGKSSPGTTSSFGASAIVFFWYCPFPTASTRVSQKISWIHCIACVRRASCSIGRSCHLLALSDWRRECFMFPTNFYSIHISEASSLALARSYDVRGHAALCHDISPHVKLTLC